MNSQPGLDITTLQGLRAPRRDLNHLHQRITEHLDAHDGYVAFSGGKDSTVVLHLALQADPEIPVAFFDSGLEYPETINYLEQLHQAWRLNLHVYPARKSMLQLLHEAGTWDHARTRNPNPDNAHTILITEPSAAAHLDHGPGELWGLRSAESQGRAIAMAKALNNHTCSCCATRHVARRRHGGTIARRDLTTAYSPVWDWSTPEIWGYLASQSIPLNPVYAKLRQLGAPEHAQRMSTMLDGNQLRDGRVTWLRRGWPDLYAELVTVLPRLQEFV